MEKSKSTFRPVADRIEIAKESLHRRDMINIFRKSITGFSRLKLKTIKISVRCDFNCTGRVDLHYTVLENGTNDNRTFSMYDFYGIDHIERLVDELLYVVENDDFKAVVRYRDGD